MDANLYLLLLKKKIKFDFKPLYNKIWYYIMLNKIRSLVGNLASREQIHEILLNNPEISKINNFRNSQWLNNQRIKSKKIKILNLNKL